MFILNLVLNLVGVAYFTCRIILCKMGYLTFATKPKRSWKRRKRRKRKRKTHHAHTTVLNIDRRIQDQLASFNTDSRTIICDNSANVHVCNDNKMFIGEIRRAEGHFVATIGGNKNSSAGIGTVRWRWKDDNGQEHTVDVHDVLYFPQSPVNILSITALADQYKDDDGTGIDTKRSKSRFYWDHNKFERTINHPPSNLPELPINEGFSMASLFSRFARRKVKTEKQH